MIFVLTRQGKAFKASAAHPYSNFPWMARECIAKKGQEFLDCIAFLVTVVNAVISLNKLKLVSFYIVTYLLQQCIDLGLGCYKHNVPQLRSSQLWSGIRHKYVFHSHEEKSAMARSEGWRSGHSPLGRGLDACHILQGTLVVAINQITSYWQNATGEKCFVKFLLYQASFSKFLFFSFFVNLN